VRGPPHAVDSGGRPLHVEDEGRRGAGRPSPTVPTLTRRSGASPNGIGRPTGREPADPSAKGPPRDDRGADNPSARPVAKRRGSGGSGLAPRWHFLTGRKKIPRPKASLEMTWLTRMSSRAPAPQRSGGEARDLLSPRRTTSQPAYGRPSPRLGLRRERAGRGAGSLLACEPSASRARGGSGRRVRLPARRSGIPRWSPAAAAPGTRGRGGLAGTGPSGSLPCSERSR
jgi:hypothetical protein